MRFTALSDCANTTSKERKLVARSTTWCMVLSWSTTWRASGNLIRITKRRANVNAIAELQG